jgi:hypothetical protein
MPRRDELRRFAIKHLSRGHGAELDDDVVNLEVVRLLRHWHNLCEPKRPTPSWPEGVDDSDPVRLWTFEGVSTSLGSARPDLWRRVLDAAIVDERAAALLCEAFPLLDYRDAHDWLLAEAPTQLPLPTHDGHFPGTDEREHWKSETPPDVSEP